MQTQKENYLRVVYDIRKGLILQWSFKDLLGRQKYFRHLFVIFNSERDEVLGFIDNFYKKIKYGDLMCCVYQQQLQTRNSSKWLQKTQINSFNSQKYLKHQARYKLTSRNKAILVERALKQANQFNEPVVINFLLDSDDNGSSLQNIIQKGLTKNQNSYITNLFGRSIPYNKQDFHQGINTFTIIPKHEEELASYYRKLINSAVVRSAKISIECLNGQISSCTETIWKNVDFNRLQSHFVGPTANYEQDLLYFYQENNYDKEYQLKINLQLTLFSMKKVQNQKIVHIYFQNQKQYFPTIRSTQNNPIKVSQNIILKANPYKSMDIVLFQSNKLYNAPKIKDQQFQE